MKDKKNILYGVIGVMTLMLSIVGATFAYFTATASNDNKITGNAATIDFDVTVTKMTTVDVALGGLIPMSNNMMEQALTKNANVSGKGICVDDNGNAVCQVYKVAVENKGTASMFVDGYVTLTNGSGTPADLEVLKKPASGDDSAEGGRSYVAKSTNATSMRWAQAFCSTEQDSKVTACTTAGNSTVRTTNTIALNSPITSATYTTLGGTATQNKGLNLEEILTTRESAVYAADNASAATIKGNKYEVIKNNYIRISDHLYTDETYTRDEDITSALVFNQYLEANDGDATNNNGTSAQSNATGADKTYKDAQIYYIVVWLSENGHNQTAGATGAATAANNFFQGKATFISAEGKEVSATFNGLARVAATDNNAAQQAS